MSGGKFGNSKFDDAEALERWKALDKSSAPPTGSTAIIEWAIIFDDPDMPTEFYTDENFAKKRFATAATNWNCHLYRRQEIR
jgi:hypothetical protein